jgi:hypothetical protein
MVDTGEGEWRGIHQKAECLMLTLMACVLWSIVGDEASFVEYVLLCIMNGIVIANVHQAAQCSKLNVKTESHFKHT